MYNVRATEQQCDLEENTTENFAQSNKLELGGQCNHFVSTKKKM